MVHTIIIMHMQVRMFPNYMIMHMYTHATLNFLSSMAGSGCNAPFYSHP